MYIVSRNTGFEGPRGGPQDAFRHTYTSALVAKYLSPKLVLLATKITENNPSSPYDIMDIHNNTLGIQVALNQFNLTIESKDRQDKDLYSIIFEMVKNAETRTSDSNKVYILEQSFWQKSDIF